MKKHEFPELAEEKRVVAEIYASNRETTSQLQILYKELTGRARRQTALWESDSNIVQDREPEYLILLRTVTSTEKEIVALLTEKVEENRQMQKLRSETSERDQVAMLSLYKKLRAAAEKEADDDLPRLQSWTQQLEKEVVKLEEFLRSQRKESDR
jgi:hypothetical protein